MPKDLKEFAQLQSTHERAGGRKVDWAEVTRQIVEAGEAYTVKEVWERFAEKKVGLFRTKGALDALVEKRKLECRYDGKRFWYSRPTEA